MYGFPLGLDPARRGTAPARLRPRPAARRARCARRMGVGDTAVNLAAAGLVLNAWILTGERRYRGLDRRVRRRLAGARRGERRHPARQRRPGRHRRRPAGGPLVRRPLRLVLAARLVQRRATRRCVAALAGGRRHRRRRLPRPGRAPPWTRSSPTARSWPSPRPTPASAPSGRSSSAEDVAHPDPARAVPLRRPRLVRLQPDAAWPCPTALWHHTASDADRERIERLRAAGGIDWRTVRSFRSKEEAGHEEPWFAFLAGDDPGYPERILAAAQAQVRHRLARMERYRDLDVPEADIHVWQQSQPGGHRGPGPADLGRPAGALQRRPAAGAACATTTPTPGARACPPASPRWSSSIDPRGDRRRPGQPRPRGRPHA